MANSRQTVLLFEASVTSANRRAYDGAPVLSLSAFGRLPVVLLDCHPSLVVKRLPCIYSDARSIARIAVRELASSGLTDMAYLPYVEPTVWSRERGEVFRDLVIRRRGKTPSRRGGAPGTIVTDCRTFRPSCSTKRMSRCGSHRRQRAR